MREPDESTPLALKCLQIGMNLKGAEPGVYFEAGANDGISQSNTVLLEQAGWTGILVEPSQVAFTALKQNRPYNHLRRTALTNSTQDKTLEGTFSSGNLMGSSHPELRFRDGIPTRTHFGDRIRSRSPFKPRIRLVKVPATTVDEVISNTEFTTIDLFVLDVEGYELQVLEGLGDHKPRVLVIETRLNDFYKISETLLKLGYILMTNLSQFSPERTPNWSGDHQDYAWCLKRDFAAITAVTAVSDV